MRNFWSALTRKPQPAIVALSPEVLDLERQVIAQSAHIEMLKKNLGRMTNVILSQRDRIVGLEKVTEASVMKLVEVEEDVGKNSRQIKRLFYDMGRSEAIIERNADLKPIKAKAVSSMPFVAPKTTPGFMTIAEYIEKGKLGYKLQHHATIGAKARKICKSQGKGFRTVTGRTANGNPKHVRAYPIEALDGAIKEIQGKVGA